ncbi:MAG: alpha/beta hydrolase [Parachlamydiales bacterium]|nr:alpha/beta hydrolase [Parachlamydiales bacterium]
MADYVLVHGGNLSTDTWNKLAKRNDYPSGEYLGGKVWDKVIAPLRKNSHRVFAPTLLDENNYDLSDHIEQICGLIKEHKLKDVILIGASYGGMVITGVAVKIKEKIALLVYLDAAFPDPGQSLFNILSSAKYDPKIVLEGFPKAYTEKLYYDPQKIESLSKVYIQCTESSFLSVTKLVKQKISKKKNWQFFELPTSHIPQATMSDKLIELFLYFGNIT